MEYLVVLMSAAAAVIVLADSRLRDPYFAFYEILPGMGIEEAALTGDRRVRAAVIRRFGYGFLLGLVLALAGADRLLVGVAAGVTISGLLLWPVVIHGLPRGRLKSDWMLLVVYGAVLAAYVGSVLAGQVFFVLVAERDLVGWLRDQVLQLVFTGVLIAIAFGIFDRWLPSARKSDDVA
jgi:hypothetical protein